MANSTLRWGLFYLVTLPLLGVSLLVAVGIGSTELPWETILRVLLARLLPEGWISTEGISNADAVIVWMIRLPRALVAALVGAGLALAGAIMQGLFRNPLAEPGLAGAGAGAVFGAVLAFVAGWSATTVITLPVCAIAGSLLSLLLVYAMATRAGITPVSTLLLAGIAVSSLLSAVSSLLISLNIMNWQVAQEIVFWMMGGLEARTWTHVWLCAPLVALGAVFALLHARELDLLQQGEDVAAAFGVDVESDKRMFIFLAALLTGASVAVAGSVAFVGLVAPHAVRMLLGPSSRTLLPASALGGATFLVLCDLLARVVHPPTELRLGVVTALVGGPMFIWLLLRRYREVSA
ncbi:MAG: iron ABC transporter permease [Bryobacterales bacterium]|jgi:iron complex transport system permease protein|nr:iron ABC transporter permease [Bryobacterales bacterium]